ncbi:MAG: hypothetical protein LBR96_00060 [Treponema sp.]|jgi:hypothetical protein|nr:hypothetical protein [Treponema sp.]
MNPGLSINAHPLLHRCASEFKLKNSKIPIFNVLKSLFLAKMIKFIPYFRSPGAILNKNALSHRLSFHSRAAWQSRRMAAVKQFPYASRPGGTHGGGKIISLSLAARRDAWQSRRMAAVK